MRDFINIAEGISIKMGGDKKKDGNLEVFMKEFYDISQGHPFNDRARILNDTVFEIRPLWGEIHISDIQAIEPRRGMATAAVKSLMALADKHGVVLSGTASAYARPGTDYISKTSDLVKWYKKLGFKVGRGDKDSGYEIRYQPAPKPIGEGKVGSKMVMAAAGLWATTAALASVSTVVDARWQNYKSIAQLSPELAYGTGGFRNFVWQTDEGVFKTWAMVLYMHAMREAMKRGDDVEARFDEILSMAMMIHLGDEPKNRFRIPAERQHELYIEASKEFEKLFRGKLQEVRWKTRLNKERDA